MPIDRKRDRVYWILFAVVTVCGLVLPLIYLLLVFSGGTIASQDTGTWKQWWAEHWYTVCTAFRVAVVEPAAGVVAAAVPVLAWRYRFGSFFCAALPALCYRFLSMLSALLTDSQLLEGTEFAAAVLWSSIIELAVLTAGYPLQYAVLSLLRRAKLPFALCALVAVLADWLVMQLNAVQTALLTFWQEIPFVWTLLIRQLPVYLVSLLLYFGAEWLDKRTAKAETERTAAEQ